MYVLKDIGNHYDISTISIRIRERRTQKGYTQQELADKIGVQRQAIINWENTKKNILPSVESLADICEQLDCSMDYLLGSVDSPEIEPISKASHYSGIKPEIIRAGIDNPDYLDCINFFMHPDNCSDIFNSVTLNTWRKFWIDSSIDEINGELKNTLIKCYDEYIAITPIDSVNKQTYRCFLESKLPRERITLKTDKDNSKIYIKKCVTLLTFHSFFTDGNFNYTSFITYLAEHTFDTLSHNMMIEIQKNKLANKFVDLFIKYLES